MNEDGDGGEGGEGVGQSEVEGGVEGESDERDGGEIGAGGRLDGVGGEQVVSRFGARVCAFATPATA